MAFAVDPFALATLILTAATTFLATWIAVRSRQLSRPRMKVHFGVTGLEADRPRAVRRHTKRVVVFGLTEVNRDYLVVPLAIGIENRTSLPVTSLRLQLEYPAECLLDGTRVIDHARATAIALGDLKAPGRRAQRVGTLAQVTYDVDMLRSKETLIFHELIRLPHRRIPSGGVVAHEAFEHRWSAVPEFVTAFAVDVAVFSANCDPTATRGVVIACESSSQDVLTRVASVLFGRMWEGERPSRGLRRAVARLTGQLSVELAELAFVPRDALDFERTQIDASVLRHSPHAVIRFDVPPWGLTDSAPRRES